MRADWLVLGQAHVDPPGPIPSLWTGPTEGYHPETSQRPRGAGAAFGTRTRRALCTRDARSVALDVDPVRATAAGAPATAVSRVCWISMLVDRALCTSVHKLCSQNPGGLVQASPSMAAGAILRALGRIGRLVDALSSSASTPSLSDTPPASDLDSAHLAIGSWNTGRGKAQWR
ncbi:hypothetical protein BV25DRAFT_1831084, partial [Artomyces pyxidatus]